MTATTASLRVRLLLLFLVPLSVIAVGLGAWRVVETNRMTEDLFDRTLLSSALAIARDVAVTEGEALSGATLSLLSETSGGPLFYHVYGPDGAFITGYGSPPIVVDRDVTAPEPVFYSGIYQGREVRVVRLREFLELDWISGFAVISVWQQVDARQAFARGLTLQTMAVISVLLVAVASIAWFGLRFGLRPLTDLEDAIAYRSSDDLSLIRRPVPHEIRGVVSRLNSLFGQVSEVLNSKDAFISDAAHQLRNPIAGVLSMSEALRGAAETPEMAKRADAMVGAARHTSRLASQHLTFERARGVPISDALPEEDLRAIAADVVQRAAPKLLRKGFEVSMEADRPVLMRCDSTLIGEAVQNLIDNAALHGGPTPLAITVEVLETPEARIIRVRDTGIGLPPDARAQAVARFSQLKPGTGSGLGLAIVDTVCTRHGGTLVIEPSAEGASLAMTFPKG